MQAVDAPQVVQPAYAPELNPVERFFRELRRAVEGRVYPDRVRQLCGWTWIREALTALPIADEVF